jgi:hypothetical protein
METVKTIDLPNNVWNSREAGRSICRSSRDLFGRVLTLPRIAAFTRQPKTKWLLCRLKAAFRLPARPKFRGQCQDARDRLSLWGFAVVGILMLMHFRAVSVEVVNDQLVITAIAAQGTNLNFSAAIPVGLGQVTLEMRPAMDAPWQELLLLDVSNAAGQANFAIPKPPGDLAFFRLKAATAPSSAPLLSAELRYATIPSLVSSPMEAVFHFKGTVDGSDRILISRDGALWNHVHWGWPDGPVAINGAQWNPREKNYLTTVGTNVFLPEPFSLDSPALEIVTGRDVVAMERSHDGLIVYVNDTPSGPADYEFTIRFHPANPKPAKPGTAARLKIAARIDGSDTLKITATEATWEHHTYQFPDNIKLNDISWSLDEGAALKNEGGTRFLPAGVDFSTASIVNRKGRDLATAWAEPDALVVRFADNPNGSDDYELEISFGQEEFLTSTPR